MGNAKARFLVKDFALPAIDNASPYPVWHDDSIPRSSANPVRLRETADIGQLAEAS